MHGAFAKTVLPLYVPTSRWHVAVMVTCCPSHVDRVHWRAKTRALSKTHEGKRGGQGVCSQVTAAVATRGQSARGTHCGADVSNPRLGRRVMGQSVWPIVKAHAGAVTTVCGGGATALLLAIQKLNDCDVSRCEAGRKGWRPSCSEARTGSVDKAAPPQGAREEGGGGLAQSLGGWLG